MIRLWNVGLTLKKLYIFILSAYFSFTFFEKKKFKCVRASFLRNSFSDNLRQYFSQFGEVRDVDIKIDMATQQSRGFGFVLFAHADSITAIEQSGKHNLGLIL